MNKDEAKLLLQSQEIGTFYITDNLIEVHDQNETVLMKVAPNQWIEQHSREPYCWEDAALISEMVGERVKWSLS